MSDTLILRVFSQAGRSRVEIQANKSLLDLKTDLAKRLGLANASIVKLYLDDKFKKPLNFRDSDQIGKLGLKNGEILHVANQGTVMTQLPPAPKKKIVIEEKKKEEEGDEEKKKDEKAEVRKDSYGRVIKTVEEKKEDPDAPSLDYRGQVIKSVKPDKKEEKKEVKMIAGASGEAPKEKNMGEDEDEKFVKHQSFDNFIAQQRNKCKDKHLPHQKCQDCAAEKDVSYKVKYDCKNHKPFPHGMCQKCLPPTVILNRQLYRHVDYVSFMNFQEISQFVGAWQQTGMYEQRMGWLYGYYSEDPNFPDGVRANIEAIYEPPQIGEMKGVQALDDPFRTQVDFMAESLGLERVGYIFTSLNQEKCFMTSEQLREVARLQQQHIVNHPAGYKVSKFVTVRVEQKENEEIGVECWMASDICQALERDNIFGSHEDPKKLIIRQPKSTEAMPAILREGTGVKEFEVDFMLISLAHGQPNSNNTKFNVLKRYDYPAMNRFGKMPTQGDFKSFLTGSKAMKGSHDRFACFQFLLHLSQVMDIDTAMSIAANVADERDIDPTMIELFESM